MSRMDIEDRNTVIDPDSLRPIEDMVLVKMISRNKTAAGLLLAKDETSEVKYGIVMAVGPGAVAQENGKRLPMPVSVGQHVAFMDYAGDRIYAVGERFRMIREHGLWAVVGFADAAYSKIKTCVPVRNKVLLRMDENEKSMSGDIFLPDNPQTMNRRGEVLSSGPGYASRVTGEWLPCRVNPGPVITSRYAGAEIRVNGEKLRLQEEEDVIAEIEGD